MSTLQEIIAALPSLSLTEKRVIRHFIDQELETTAKETPGQDAYQMIGLLADDPDLADFISESAMQAREKRPYRVQSE